MWQALRGDDHACSEDQGNSRLLGASPYRRASINHRPNRLRRQFTVDQSDQAWVTESFFSSLKKGCIRKRVYKTRDLARADVFDYIEVFYSRTRRHSHLGGVSPEAFEKASLWGWSVS
ncbi:IS3 family transposase [Dyella terrae]|nr:IS3 family transposase [Dyella terrae]